MSLHVICLLALFGSGVFTYGDEDVCSSNVCSSNIKAALLKGAHQSMHDRNGSTFIAFLGEPNGDVEAAREYIHQYFSHTFDLFYSLYDNIKDEFFWHSACKLRWPVGWYMAHSASFYANKLRMYNVMHRADQPLHAEFDYLFAQGTDEAHWFDFVPQFSDDPSHWPAVADAKQYCNDTRDIVSGLILREPLPSLPIDESMTFWWAILMAIEHERVHLETSAMLVRQLPMEAFKDTIRGVWSVEHRTYAESTGASPPSAPQNELVAVNATNITYGRAAGLFDNTTRDFFGWDCEYGQFAANVSAFNASKYLVSNAEYFEFYEDGGYQTPRYWSDKGWRWRTETGARHPRFWRKTTTTPDGDEDTDSDVTAFRLRNTFSEMDMTHALSYPVITNGFEAEAFIAWKSDKLGKHLRLLTEAEWYVLRTLPAAAEFATHNLRDWHTILHEFPANTNFYYFASEAPVDWFEFGDTGLFDVVGNLHQHTLSVYHPFEGYQVSPLYVDFSTPFFNESYRLMKGGSWISSGNMAMAYNRNQWFRGHYFQATGIRYVESTQMDKNALNSNCKTTTEYFADTSESNELCHRNIGRQYSDAYRQMVVQYVNRSVADRVPAPASVLHLACNVGGVTYELAKHFTAVIGIDNRPRFVGLANQMQQNQKLEYVVKNENGEDEQRSVSLQECKMENVTDKVEFICDETFDALSQFDSFDLIVGHNVFDTYQNELQQFEWRDILNENGTIILFDEQHSNTQEMQRVLGGRFSLRETFVVDDPMIPDTTCTVWSINQ